jgi:hypothetical protein
MRQVQVGLVESRLRLFDLALELADLCVGFANALGHRRVLRHLRFGERHLRLGLLQRRRGGVDVLLRRRRFRQALLPIEIRLSLREIGLGVLELRCGLLQLRREVLFRDFEPELLPPILCVGGGERAFGLFAIDLILPRVDVDQRLTLFDELIVGDVELHHDARHLRRNRDRAAVGIGIVGVFDVARREPVIDATDGQQRQYNAANNENHRLALLFGFIVLFVLCVLFGGCLVFCGRLVVRGCIGPAGSRLRSAVSRALVPLLRLLVLFYLFS